MGAVEHIVYTLTSVVIAFVALCVLTPIAGVDYAYRVNFLSTHEYQPATVSNKVKLKSMNTKADIFNVVTTDCHVLTLEHLLRPNKGNKRPLLLLTNVPSMALPLVFLDTHDVWIGYGRMSSYADHMSFSTSDVEFWDSWSAQDIISLDYPAFISYIKNITEWSGPIDVAGFGYNATLLMRMVTNGNPVPSTINKIVLLDPMDSGSSILRNFWLNAICSLPWELLCGLECFRLHFVDFKDLAFDYIEKLATPLLPVVHIFNWIQRCLLVYLLYCDDYKWDNYKQNDLVDSLPGLCSLKKSFELFKNVPSITVGAQDFNSELLILQSKFTKTPTEDGHQKTNRILYHHFDFVYANDVSSIIQPKLDAFFST